MSTPTNHWKLGLFVVVGFCIGLFAVLFLGARTLHKVTVLYTTYFDESVQGLEIGSPVKFRGVVIGNVSAVGVAEDHRHVEVMCELGVKQLNRLGLSEEKNVGKLTKLALPPDLRVQIGSGGLTGVKFILVDYFPVKDYPLLKLPFDLPENYIPSVPSVMKNLEDSVVHATDRFPALADELLKVLARVNGVLDEIERRRLIGTVVATLGNLDQLLLVTNQAIKQMDTAKLSTQAQATMGSLNMAVANVNALVGKVGGEQGLLASAQRTSDSLGGVAQNANHVGPALEETLREVQSAAEAIRQLAESLDRDPDMLLKGKAKRRTQ